jgi:hypothetical protein
VADDDFSRSPAADELAATLTERVRAIVAAAEAAAAQLRAQADADAEERARQVRLAAEQDAERLLRRAEREAAQYLEGAIRRVDAFAAGRARRISAVADQLIAHTQALTDRAGRATRLEHGIDAVVEALAAAAEAVAAEARRAPVQLPGARPPAAEVTRLTTRPHAVPDPEPGEPSPADDAREHVREIASALPRRPGVQRRSVPAPPPPPGPPRDPFDGPDAAA